MLAIPVLTPPILAGSAVAGERQQSTPEPVLTTPIRREEFLAGKALAVLVPSAAIADVVYALFLAVVVVLFAEPGVASAIIQIPDFLAQVLLARRPKRRRNRRSFAIWLSRRSERREPRCGGLAEPHRRRLARWAFHAR